MWSKAGWKSKKFFYGKVHPRLPAGTLEYKVTCNICRHMLLPPYQSNGALKPFSRASCGLSLWVKTRASMSASANRRVPPEYHPPPPVRPYANFQQADGSSGSIQMSERGRKGGRDERPDLNSFTTKKSVSAGGIIVGSNDNINELKPNPQEHWAWVSLAQI